MGLAHEKFLIRDERKPSQRVYLKYEICITLIIHNLVLDLLNNHDYSILGQMTQQVLLSNASS